MVRIFIRPYDRPAGQHPGTLFTRVDGCVRKSGPLFARYFSLPLIMMNSRRKTILFALLKHRRKKQRNRQIWVHPLLESRYLEGAFFVLFQQLKEDETKFLNYFRMSVSSFDELLQRVQTQLQRQDTNMRNCIQPEQMLAVTLRYLASGCSFTDLYYSYRLGISTISKIVREVCDILWSCLVEECIPKLTKERFESVAAGFKKRANFFHCIGAVDGKHIRIVKPEFSGSLYYNYKSYFSVVLMAVADSNYRFIYVDVGAYGSECDSSIFKESSLWKSIQKKSLELPSAKPLSGSEASNVPYFLIGDEAFGLNINLLRPFGGKELSQKKRIFNYRLSRARRYVECSNSNKWRILHRSLNVNTDFAVSIVKACVVLHNFVRERDGYNFEDTMTVVGMNDLPAQANMQGGRAANNIRNVLSDYFLTEVGKVSWQLSKI
ncbi:unnamed protein product [Acanthoscelides obtectus]|uniref:DDE Tnp4 domain-containing protein n=1 Tax=Acanthoscelides obtectus TaxID=200917 RepID=A0A9P0P8B4_ACAOB|nr:unnamed protein product [Acanthoscelides obtectus]CAK1632285.1 Protein ALP1-like [Acanthoscelides obtectus]